ncbi:MAG TPA: acyltransferase [Actinomycetota bacterium]|nr:acyltransferase [Actinomycetota bacterium]
MREPAVASTEAPTPGRVASIDNLKVIMVAGVIAWHAVAGYLDMEGVWTYGDVAEARFGTVSEAITLVLVGPASMFVMGLFFLLAGMLTPGSLDRKGPRRFAHDRLVRLGIPLAAFTFVLWPLMTFGLYQAAGVDRGLWNVYADPEPPLDNGVLWFVEVLLIYSLGYAAWRAWRARRGHGPSAGATGELAVRHLVATGVAIAIGSFVVRLWFPFSTLQVMNLHLWQWPQCLGLFALGVVVARRGWLNPVPERIRRGCGVVAVIAALALGAVFATAEKTDRAFGAFAGGWRWQALVLAAIEGALAVSASIWVLAFAQRHGAHAGRTARAMARGAYAAFMLQGLVLLPAALALRPFEVPVEVKAVLVAAAGIAGSFALGWVLVTRTRLGRIM